MNCHDIVTILDETLLRQRNPQWLREAYRHADQCPSCARLMALHRLEEQMTELPVIEPSKDFVQSVMSRISQPEPIAIGSSRLPWWSVVKYLAIVVGALALAAVYGFMAAHESWLSNLWPVKGWLPNLRPSVEPTRAVETWTYFAYHPWAMLLGVTASLLLVFGLAGPESQVTKMTWRSP